MKKHFKKLLALVLSLALLVSCLVVPGIVTAEDDATLDIWDGTYVMPSDTDGDGAFEIYTPEELAWFVKFNGRVSEVNGTDKATAKLMNDIWLNDMLVTVIDGVPSATKATDTSVVIDLEDDENNGLNEWFEGVEGMWFVGTIDGNNHVVNGLYVKDDQAYSSNSYGAGLVPRAGGGCTVKNLGIENAYMNTNNDYTAAFFIGSVQSSKGTVINSYVGESAYHTGVKAAAIVGGGGQGAVVKDCYTHATIVKSNTASGVIIGDSWGGEKIYNCYTTNGYALRRGSYGTLQGSYSLTVAPTVEDVPQLGGAYLLINGDYPVLKSFVEGSDKEWNGLEEIPVDLDGDGMYEIDNASAFYYATKPGAPGNREYEITDDIIFNDITVKIEDGVGAIYDADGNKVEDYATLNKWHSGADAVSNVVFHGNNHTVRGIFSNHAYDTSVSANNQGTALINKGWNIDFYNLGVEDMYINVTDGTAAGFVANVWNQDGNSIENCYLAESVYLNGTHAAGVFGCGGASSKVCSVKNSYILATITSTGKKGAITGDIWSCDKYTVENTYATTSFWGNNPGTSTNSYNVSASNIVGTKAPAAMPLLSGFTMTEKYPTLKVFYNENVWGGWVVKPATGTGTAADPFIITNGEELAYAINNTAKFYVEDEDGTLMKVETEGEDGTVTTTYETITDEAYEGTRYSYVAPSYKLANDIYLNDLSKIDWSTGTVAEGYLARSWYKDTATQGTFDGDGHVVYGMYYNVTPTVNWLVSGSVALFPRILDGATLNVTGLGVDYAYVSAPNNAAAFVGSNSANNQTTDTKTYLNISESYTGENVILKSYLTGSVVAGLRDLHANISDCYFLDTQSGSLSTSNYGITGDAWGGSARYYRVYSPTQPLSSKGSNIAEQSNCYTYIGAPNAGTEVTDIAMQGKNAIAAMSGLGDKFVTTEGYPALAIFLKELTDANIPLGTVPFEGTGTEEDPYLISDAADLKAMVGLGGQDAYYELTNDIYVNDVNAVDWLTGTVNEGYAPTEWFAGDLERGQGYTGYTGTAQQFSGTVNGNGYAIHGLYYELGNTHTVVGLIPYASSVTITDLGIEDSFIGGGRFTGGMIGYTVGSATVTVTGSYIDDSCAVLGWDAGAAYVDADSDIHTSGGAGLCTGNSTEVYVEDAAGTYILDGETYREFTAADYTGTKYAYDEETATYVENAEGTYLLDADGVTYREITVDDYTGTRYSVDIVWSNVGFTSEAVGGIIGRVESGSVGTIENCYVTANVSTTALTIYGFNSQGVTFAQEGTNGAGCGHTNGIWGDDWGATVTVTNCFSTKLPHENINEGKTTFTNVYTTDTKTLAGVTNITVATGAEGLTEMTGLDTSVWYAVKADGAYPALRLRGTVIGDVDENGVGGEVTDLAALRAVLMDDTAPNNADINRNSTVNICDLVALASR